MSERATRRFLVLIVATLIGFGCVAVYSATAIMGHETYGRTLHYMISHVLAIGVGLVLGFACLAVPHDALRRAAKPLIAVSLALLVAVCVFGTEAGGARRWFRIGRFGIQPSEFAQIALIIYLADYLARKAGRINRLKDGFLPPLIVTGLLAVLVLVQPDLGTAIVMGSVAILLLILAKASWKHVGITAALGAVALVVLIAREEYRMRRMLAFLNPWEDPQGVGFQILQSYIALANGGLFGQGLGESMQKLFYLPGAHTDFIFAVIGEELGLLGTTAVIGLFALFVVCGMKMALMAQDSFSKYLISGCVGMIGFEAVVNIAVVTGMMPTKGLPLPLVSYGGTAMISNCLACALILRGSCERSIRV